MAQARLASGIWVSAYLARLRLADIPAYVIAHGDDIAGSVMVKCARLDGTAQLYVREWDFETDTQNWQTSSDGSERDIDETIRRQRGYDRDLWVIEIESRDGQTLLEQDGLG